MTANPSQFLPETERLVFRCLCANEQPLPVTDTQWNVRYSRSKVSHYKHIPYATSSRTEMETVRSFPHAIMKNSNDFIMLRVTGDRPEVVTLIDKKKHPGMALDDALSAGYGFSYMQEYALYHAQPLHPSSIVRHSELFGTEHPPQEYFVVMKKSAYQKLAMQMLIKLGNKERESFLLQWPEKKALRGDYTKKDSSSRRCVERIIENAGLASDQIHEVMDNMVAAENYELAAALRDIITEGRIGYVGQEQQRRGGSAPSSGKRVP